MQQFELDACGLMCPMPVIKLKMLLSQIRQEAIDEYSIVIRFTDKGGIKDVPAFCLLAKLDCLAFDEVGNAYSYVIKSQSI